MPIKILMNFQKVVKGGGGGAASYPKKWKYLVHFWGILEKKWTFWEKYPQNICNIQGD